LVGLYGLLLACDLAAWACALVLFADRPVLLGTARLAAAQAAIESGKPA